MHVRCVCVYLGRADVLVALPLGERDRRASEGPHALRRAGKTLIRLP